MTEQPATLRDTDRQFLTFALDLAADKMASRGDEFDDDDTAALATLRRLASTKQQRRTVEPTTPYRSRCAHGYWLMQDSCPGCDAEQETPHEADPATVRPGWAKRDMRRCRRCALVPSHRIHKAPRPAKDTA